MDSNLEKNMKMEMEVKQQVIEKDSKNHDIINGTTSTRSNTHIEEHNNNNNNYYKMLEVPYVFFDELVKAVLRCLGFEQQHSSSSSSESTSVCSGGVKPDVGGTCGGADVGDSGCGGGVTDPGADDAGGIEANAMRKPPRPGVDRGRPGQIH